MGGGWTKTKLMLFSTQVKVVVEVGVELGNNLIFRIGLIVVFVVVRESISRPQRSLHIKSKNPWKSLKWWV